MKKVKVYRPRRGMRFRNGRRGVSPTAGFVSGPAVTRTAPTVAKVNLGLRKTDSLTVCGSVMSSLTGSSGTQTISGSVSYGRAGARKALNDSILGINAPRRATLTPGKSVSTNGFDPNIGFMDTAVPTWDAVFAARVQGSSGNGISFRFSSNAASAVSVVDDLTNRIVNIQVDGISNATTFGRLESLINASSSLIYVAAPSTIQSLAVSSGFSPRTGSLIGGRDAGQAINVSGVLSPNVASIPSWTHSQIGTKQGFVIGALTSSYHESNVLNYYLSGSQAVEQTAVPASASVYMAKTSRFQTIVVKHTASFFDTIVPTVGGIPVSGVHVPTSFVALTGAFVNTVTGTNGIHVSVPQAPATFFMNVPASGRLVDIKVWVELVHVSASSRTFPLGTLAIALRSPNVRWGIAHPMMNDPQIFDLLKGVEFREDDGQIWDLYKDSFLLWEGGSMFGNDTGPEIGTVNNGGSTPGMFNGGRDTQRYPTWQKDRGMRVVFYDGANVANPRHHYNRVSPSGNFNGSPNASFGINSAYGCDIPWTSDAGFGGSRSAAGSPPAGWLSGPANAAAVNEWSTTGSNYGTNVIRPILPLLDSVYGKKSVGTEGSWAGGAFIDTKLFRGFRPGLRGTEISGTWQILVSTIPTTNLGLTASMDCYFRQARLEITYESQLSSEPVITRASSRLAPRRAGETFLYQMSGSAKFQGVDSFVNQLFTTTSGQSEIGRTFGLQMLDSGTLLGNNALGYKLTGTLGNIFGPHPTWLIDAQTGVPSIPMSSASLAPPNTSASIDSTRPTDYLSPRKTLDGAQRLADVATDFNPQQTLVQMAAVFVSASST